MLWSSSKQPVLLSDCGRSNGVFHEVVVELEATIFEIDTQKRPIGERVIDGLAKSAARQIAAWFGDANAGQRSAILYTMIESCRCRGIDPYAYLRDVLTRLPSMTNWQVKDITPEAWRKLHAPLQRQLPLSCHCNRQRPSL